MSVASAFPTALAVGEIDARQDAPVEAERMAFVDDEIVEVRLEPGRRPALLDAPSFGTVGYRDPADARSEERRVGKECRL